MKFVEGGQLDEIVKRAFRLRCWMFDVGCSMLDVTHPASAPIMKPVFCLPLSGMARRFPLTSDLSLPLSPNNR
jgi:hypothetical protein